MMLTEERVRKTSRPVEMPQMVEPDEYCQLLISLRSLERCDDPKAGLRRLRDLETGILYAVEDVRLMKFREHL